MFNRAYAHKHFKSMENIHEQQAEVLNGDLRGFHQFRIQQERANIEALLDKICEEACPAGMAEVVQEMSWCLSVLAEETEINVNSLLTPLWRLSNLHHLLLMLSASKRNIRSHEKEMALLKK